MNDSNKKKKPRRYRHLSDEERYDIIGYMDQEMSFRAIGRRIGRSASTVEREARRGLERKKGWQKTPCPYLGKKGVSVCNQCRHKTECLRPKVYYHAAEASEKAYGKRHALRRTRTAPELMKAIDAEVNEGTDKGQSIEYIQHFYPSSRKVSVATIRRWIIQGRLSVSPIRLRRRRAYRKKYAYKRPKSDFERLCALKAGHTMREYRIFRREHPEIPVIELDSVEGKTSDERSILTIMFVSEHFQYGRVYSKSDGPSEVAGYLRILLGELSDVAPGKEFVFLADNGIEFDGIVPLEKEFPSCTSSTPRPTVRPTRPTASATTRNSGTSSRRGYPWTDSARRTSTRCSPTSIPMRRRLRDGKGPANCSQGPTRLSCSASRVSGRCP